MKRVAMRAIALVLALSMLAGTGLGEELAVWEAEPPIGGEALPEGIESDPAEAGVAAENGLLYSYGESPLPEGAPEADPWAGLEASGEAKLGEAPAPALPEGENAAKYGVPEALTLGVKESYTLKCTKKRLSYSSSKPAVASVSAKGVVKARKKGSATITVYSDGKKAATCKVTVKKAPGKVTLSKGTLKLAAGRTALLKATLPGGTASKLTWSSSKKKVATVDSRGVVTAVAPGKAKITVKTFNGHSATCQVTVTKGANQVKISVNTGEAGVDELFYLSWSLPAADNVVLYVRKSDGVYKSLGFVPKTAKRHEMRNGEVGTWVYVLMAQFGDEWVQSNDAIITITNDKSLLFIDRSTATAGKAFYLNWRVPSADSAVLYVRRDGEGYESLGSVKNAESRHREVLEEEGVYCFVLMLHIGESWVQSNDAIITITESEAPTLAQLKKQGYTNQWNIQFMIYRNVRAGSFSRSFTDGEVSHIRNLANRIQYTLEGLSKGRMKVKVTGVSVVETPVTSASGYLSSLTYGTSGDVNFDNLLERRDVTLVAVFVPVLGLPGTENWLGLGGTYYTYNGRHYYTLNLNDILRIEGTWSRDGKTYDLAISALVHEILHGVETNSRINGWSDFQLVHDNDANGYHSSDIGFLDWYGDLMTDTLSNGKRGFKKVSFYVPHG